MLALTVTACGHKWQETEKDGFKLVVQKGGATLGYTSAPLLIVDGYAFKDLDRSGSLDPYEDWRLPAETRAKDLASKLSIEEIFVQHTEKLFELSGKAGSFNYLLHCCKSFL
jgi:beta-glucosidase